MVTEVALVVPPDVVMTDPIVARIDRHIFGSLVVVGMDGVAILKMSLILKILNQTLFTIPVKVNNSHGATITGGHRRGADFEKNTSNLLIYRIKNLTLK